jgi:hypothetical protein
VGFQWGIYRFDGKTAFFDPLSHRKPIGRRGFSYDFRENQRNNGPHTEKKGGLQRGKTALCE